MFTAPLSVHKPGVTGTQETSTEKEAKVKGKNTQITQVI